MIRRRKRFAESPTRFQTFTWPCAPTTDRHPKPIASTGFFSTSLLYEERSGERFDVIVTHDAEDLIHPDELRWINFYSARYDFIQTPVLALATPLRP